jgi:hypothetical protein
MAMKEGLKMAEEFGVYIIVAEPDSLQTIQAGYGRGKAVNRINCHLCGLHTWIMSLRLVKSLSNIAQEKPTK